MAEDIREGFKESKRKTRNLKSFTEVKTDYEKFLSNASDNVQKIADNIQINLDSASISRKIKEKYTDSFQELIDLITQVKGNNKEGKGEIKEILIDILKSQLLEIPTMVESIIRDSIEKSTGCSEEQTYQTNQELYVNVKDIDIFNQLNVDPNSILGSSIYEKDPYDPLASKRSTNRFFYELIQTPSVQQSYFGLSGQELFKISYETFNGVEQGNYFKVTLSERVNAPNRVTDFLTDYFATLKMLDFNNAVTKIIDLILNLFTYNGPDGPAKINDNKKFILLIQRILGLCFDSAKEIDVGGISKYPEYDDTSNTFFEFTPNELSQISNEISIIRTGHVELIDCDNVQLPISDVDYVFDIISQINPNGTDMVAVFDDIYFNLSNDPRWQANAIYPKTSWNDGIIKNFVKGIVMTSLSPKVVFPLIVISKSLLSTVSNLGDEIVTDLEASAPSSIKFIKDNRKFVIEVTSKISALFIEALFNEFKKEILKIVKIIIRDLIASRTKRSSESIKSILENVERLIRGGISIVQDFRSCESLLQLLFNLLKAIPVPQKYILQTTFLYLTEYLPGILPQKEVIEYINQMGKLGIPTGTGLNGEPDLATIEKFAVFNATFLERARNGKIEGVLVTETIPPTGYPSGNVRVTGKHF